MKVQEKLVSERPAVASSVSMFWGIHMIARISVRATGIQRDFPVLRDDCDRDQKQRQREIPGHRRDQEHGRHNQGESEFSLRRGSRPVNECRNDHGDRQVRQQRAPACQGQVRPQRLDGASLTSRVEQPVPESGDRQVVAEAPELGLRGQDDPHIVVIGVEAQHQDRYEGESQKRKRGGQHRPDSTLGRVKHDQEGGKQLDRGRGTQEQASSARPTRSLQCPDRCHQQDQDQRELPVVDVSVHGMAERSAAKTGKYSVLGTTSTTDTITRLTRNAAREIAFQTNVAAG